jgi:hypothetical protein
VAEESQRRLVGPVNVVEHDDECIPAACRTEQSHDSLEKGKAQLVGIGLGSIGGVTLAVELPEYGAQPSTG